MSISQTNRARWRSVLISREVKWLLCAVPERFRARLNGRLWRWLFVSAEGELHRASEVMVADLRDYAGIGNSGFSDDPLMMARFAGRRETVLRILNYLYLDEAVVGKIMELDDGFGE